MADRTTIEWTDATWNPVTGCTKVSPGCDHCYAERFSERFRGTRGHPFETGFDLTLRPERLEQPLRWREPRMIFVNSMSDLFQRDSEGLRRARVRHHGASFVAHIPSADQAFLPDAQLLAHAIWQRARSGAYVVWGVGRGRKQSVTGTAPA
jgi:Protein of unknown function (DUF5131)